MDHKKGQHITVAYVRSSDLSNGLKVCKLLKISTHEVLNRQALHGSTKNELME